MSYSIENPDIVVVDHGSYLQLRNPLMDEVVFSADDTGPKGVMFDVLHTPLGERSFDLTQLSKTADHETIPDTHRFNRFGHVAMVTEITNRIGRREKVSSDKVLAYVLSAALDDLAHGPLSHATDIAVEGPGQKERFHQERAPEALQLGGVIDVLKGHDIKTNKRGEMKGIVVPPWVECGAPDVCVDRLQYTLQELLLWFSGSNSPEAETIREILTSIASLDNIAINNEGNMVFLDEDEARLFSKGYLLLSTEHWNDLVNRVQLYLLIEALKYSIIERRLPYMSEIDHGITRQPLDYLYAVDSDIIAAMQPKPGDTDPYLFAIANQLAGVGYEERGRFKNFKRPVFEAFLTDAKASEYPSALLHAQLADFGPESSRFETRFYKNGAKLEQLRREQNPQVPHLVSHNGNLHYVLLPLKNRFLDPLVRTRSGDIPLSEVDPRYAELLAQHQQIQQATLSVHIPTTTAYRKLLWEQALSVSEGFSRAQEQLEPMNRDPKRRSIESAAKRALAAAMQRGQYIQS